MKYMELFSNEKIELYKFNIRKYYCSYIWNSAKLEGLPVTYSDTETLVNNMYINNMSYDSARLIINLKHAWEFLLDTLGYKVDYRLICQYNSIIGKDIIFHCGEPRVSDVKIGGTDWIPSIPNKIKIIEDLNSICFNEISIDTCLNMVCYLMRCQIFYDGNKRTSIMIGNHYLVSNGLGILTIEDNNISEFKSLLIDFYKSNDSANIIEFLKNKCLVNI